MKLSKTIVMLAMVSTAQYAHTMQIPMDIQVKASTALARLGRMTFTTKDERTDGIKMIRVLNDFGKKYPEYAEKADEWLGIMNDVKNGMAVIDKKTGKITYTHKQIEQEQKSLKPKIEKVQGPTVEKGQEQIEPVKFELQTTLPFEQLLQDMIAEKVSSIEPNGMYWTYNSEKKTLLLTDKAQEEVEKAYNENKDTVQTLIKGMNGRGSNTIAIKKFRLLGLLGNLLKNIKK